MDVPLNTTVSWLLNNARTLPRWAIACLPMLSPLAPQDQCLIIDGRDLAEDEDVPEDARVRGLTRTLGARAIVGVLDNLEQQISMPTEADKIDALNYFIAADAFISVSSDG